MNKPVKILIVDPSRLDRDGIKYRLAVMDDWIVCGETDTPRGAIRLIQETDPDVVILDLAINNGSRLDLINTLTALPKPPKVLVCTMRNELLYAPRALQAGARGFLHKLEASEKIVTAMHTILDGNTFASEQVKVAFLMLSSSFRPPKSVNPIDELTDRELHVFESIARGMSVRKIAKDLFLSTKTVETYRDRVKKKLNLKTTHELVLYAVTWATQNGEHTPAHQSQELQESSLGGVY